MTLPASDLMMATLPLLITPQLARAVSHYRDEMGFEVVQHVAGVVALLRLGDVTIYLWQRASDDLVQRHAPFKPGQHRAMIACAFKVHAKAMEALKLRCVTQLAGTDWPELQRLSGPPQLQSWGAWEFSIIDGDGNVLHFVQWVTSGLPEQVEPVDSIEIHAPAQALRAPKPWSAPAQKLKQARGG